MALRTNFIINASDNHITLANEVDQNVKPSFYPRKLWGCRITTSTHHRCAGKVLGIDSENRFLAKLKSGYKDAFPDLVHITNYNKQRKKLLFLYLKKLVCIYYAYKNSMDFFL